MNDETPNLQLPYISPDQAQKHVTHNEALQRLDGLSQIILIDTASAPPDAVNSGDTYAVGSSATGVWYGHDGDIAVYQDGNWLFSKPKRGWLAWLGSRGQLACHDGTSWTELKCPQLVLQDITATPPASPSNGSIYAVTASATGAWAGHDGELAIFQSGSWIFTRPKKGSLAWLESKSTTLCFDGTTWFDMKPAAQAQITLQDILATPPANPVANATYAVAAGGTGLWAGHDGETAVQQSGSWVFTKQKKGTLAWLESKSTTLCFDGTAWFDMKPAPQAQITLQDILATPPANPVANATYAVATGGTGPWAGHDGETTVQQAGSWVFTKQKKGTLAWLESKSGTVCFDGTAWGEIKISPPAQLNILGINATADTTNRLWVSSGTSLFDNAGAGHQLKINKKNTTDTASVLFQAGYSGRAEIGLTGDNNLNFKLSPDGTNFNTWMSIDPNGVPRMPGRPVCRASAATGTVTPTQQITNFGFTQFSVNQGFSLGTALASPGTGNYLSIPTAGLYLVLFYFCTSANSGSYNISVMNGTTKILTVYQLYGVNAQTTAGSTIASFNANDQISIQSFGTAKIEFGPGKTELSLIML